MIPRDPLILLSFVNLKLRDFYPDLDALCEDLDVEKQEIADRLAEIGCRYDKDRNQFIGA